MGLLVQFLYRLDRLVQTDFGLHDQSDSPDGEIEADLLVFDLLQCFQRRVELFFFGDAGFKQCLLERQVQLFSQLRAGFHFVAIEHAAAQEDTTHLRVSIEQLDLSTDIPSSSPTSPHPYLQLWCDTEAKVRLAIDETLENIEELFEGKVAWLISQVLPPETSLFIANSMPVRDVEFFWKPNNFHGRSYFNRGANGIDGTLSTALGVAHRQSSSVMLTGDLALLHDTNGFLIRNRFIGHLTIILINNNGGGIFEMLPIANFDPPFEEFFATPQYIDFAKLCYTYGIEHELIITWQQLQARLNPLPSQGIRVLELRTSRKADAKWRQGNLGKFSLMFR